MLKEPAAAEKPPAVKIVVAIVLLLGAIGFVAYRVAGMFSEEKTPTAAVQQAESHAEELKAAADKLPPEPPPPPPPSTDGPPTRAPRRAGGG